MIRCRDERWLFVFSLLFVGEGVWGVSSPLRPDGLGWTALLHSVGVVMIDSREAILFRMANV